MCDYDDFVFTCGHSVQKLKSHCHQARNHPQHICYFVQFLRNVWPQGRKCDACVATEQAAAGQHQIRRAIQ
jgi:hypothetical protein